jgi:hypothetical protein
MCAGVLNHELFNTADKLRHKAEALKDAESEQSGGPQAAKERHNRECESGSR